MNTNIKHPRLTRALCILVAVLMIGGVLAVCDRILMPKYITASREGSLTEEYYAAVEKTNHDVLFIGDCEAYESFVPAILWQEYGISAYVRGGAQQLVWHSYYLLEDALRYETPRAVVYNVLALKYGTPQKEGYNRLNLDGMAWSSSKVDAIRASMTEEESFASYVFPLLRYHGRWDELTAEDFRYAFGGKPTVTDSGYLMQTAVVPPDDDSEQPISPLADPTLPATAMAYLDKMETLCRERGIELILIKAPTDSWGYHWYDEWDAQIVDYAEERGLAYYNLIPKSDEIGLDMTTDTYDKGVHLNVSGAEKLSRYFGNILKADHGIPDRRSDEDCASVWQTRVDTYYERKENMMKGNS